MTVRKEYKELMDSISPDEGLVEETKAKMRYEAQKTQRRPSESRVVWKRFGMAFAAAFALFFVAVNAMPAFAAQLEGIPVLGGLARVLTISSYTEREDGTEITVERPEVQADKEEAQQGIADINALIKEKVDRYVSEAMARIDEYKAAYLATGGTEEEFSERSILVDVTYEIMSHTDDRLSLVVYCGESWVSAYTEVACYNIDLSTGKEMTLEEVLGSDYIAVANASIKEQIAERTAKGETFFDFDTIDENTSWYINESGNVVVMFEKYEIAPGSSGIVKFEIAR